MSNVQEGLYGKVGHGEVGHKPVNEEKAVAEIVKFLGPRRREAFLDVAGFQVFTAIEMHQRATGHNRAFELPELTEHRNRMTEKAEMDMGGYGSAVNASARLAEDLGLAVGNEIDEETGVVAKRLALAAKLLNMALDTK